MIKHNFNHNWHVAINRYTFETGHENTSFMYEAKTLSQEVPRLTMLFAKEREGTLATVHKQCSLSPEIPVANNHLTCCLGIKCKDCPELKALELIEGATPEQVDTVKAWTCCAHIVSKGGDMAGEGYILTVNDRMFWDNVYQSMSTETYEP